MAITIKRENVFFSGFTRLRIYINDEKVDSLTSGEEKEIEISGQEAVIRVSRFGEGSNTLKVFNGDHIHVSVANWAPWFYTFIFLLMPALTASIEFIEPMITIILVSLFYLFVSFLFKPFRLIKVPSILRK